MQIKETPAMRVLCVERRLSIAEIGKTAGPVTAAMEAEAERCGMIVAGPWTFIAQNLPRDGKTLFDLRFCLPVNADAVYDGAAFALVDLEPIMAASAVYQGPLRSLFTKGYAPLVAEIENSRHVFSGESREVYHQWGRDGSGYQRIEIQFGLAR